MNSIKCITPKCFNCSETLWFDWSQQYLVYVKVFLHVGDGRTLQADGTLLFYYMNVETPLLFSWSRSVTSSGIFSMDGVLGRSNDISSLEVKLARHRMSLTGLVDAHGDSTLNSDFLGSQIFFTVPNDLQTGLYNISLNVQMPNEPPYHWWSYLSGTAHHQQRIGDFQSTLGDVYYWLHYTDTYPPLKS
jgi:hypothetical protein